MSIIPNINNKALQLLPDIALWKQQIADAINYKGGEAEPTQAFSTLAEEIKEIPNFDQWARLAGVLAGNSYLKNSLQGHNENVEAGNLTKITDPLGTFTRINSYAFRYWDLLEEVELPYTKSVETRAISFCINLKVIKLNSIKVLSGANVFNDNPKLEVLYAPLLSNITSNDVFQNTDNLKDIVVGTLNIMNNTFLNAPKKSIRNITIGEGTDIDIPFRYWTATNVINEGRSGVDELNSNLYNNLLTKLYDHSNDGVTRILQIGWLDYITPEHIAYANAKGWTITN